MEFVDGEGLDRRLAGGAIPTDEALAIARQLADALDAAHEHGIVHRDLKPANIKVTDEGQVKVLDFGIAKAIGPAGDDSSDGATITTPAMTRAGVVLGTAAYMSPEQARGRTVDKRADIWAFGVVLWEMLTGRRLFAGDTVSDTLVEVLTKQIDVAALPAGTPPHVRRLIERCLARDPKSRLRDIGDAMGELQDHRPASTEAVSAPLSRGPRAWGPLTLAVASVIVAVVSGIAAWRLAGRPTGSPVMRLEITLPPDVELFAGYAPTAALSPDGRQVAFVGVIGGVRQVFVRDLDSFEARPLKGTDLANACFFSPDGASIAFLTSDRVLKIVSLADGLVMPLAHGVSFNTGGAWGPDGRIRFGRDGVLWEVPATGGSPKQLTSLDAGRQDVVHGWPAAVADGVVLFTVIRGGGRGDRHIEALTDSGARQVVVESAAFPLTSKSHLVFFRDGDLLGAALDADRLALTTAPVRVMSNVPVDFMGVPLAAVSSSAFISPPVGAGSSRLVWVSRQGVQEPAVDKTERHQMPRLSPDGRRIVVQATGQILIYDLERGTASRVTSGDTLGNSFPVWTADGRRVVFRTMAGLCIVNADGGGSAQAIPHTSLIDIPTSVSPDGKTLAFIRQTADKSGEVYVLSLDGDPRPRSLVSTRAYEGGAQFSPDGRWLAYTSDESGQTQVFIRPAAGPDRRWLVSVEGGRHPLWSRSGRELFYRNANQMMVVDVSTAGDDVRLSRPRLLFDQRYAFGSALTIPNYDVSADGQRFLMVRDESSFGRLNLVLNWAAELERLAPRGR
jgi:serine/threonine-protein kinase